MDLDGGRDLCSVAGVAGVFMCMELSLAAAWPSVKMRQNPVSAVPSGSKVASDFLLWVDNTRPCIRHYCVGSPEHALSRVRER